MSVHKLLAQTIRALDLGSYFSIDVRAITSINGSAFDFEGLFANVDKIKSFEGADIIWVEEAATITADSWEIVEPTLRKPSSYFLVNYNPDRADDPTFKMFGDAPRPDAIVEHVTYQDNPHLTEPLRQSMDYRRRVDEDAYRHIWLGQTRAYSDAQILKGKVVVEDFEPLPTWDGPYFGLDFGFSQDPNAGIRCYVDGTTLYIEREVWAIKCELDHTPRFLEGLGKDCCGHVMRADSARPDSISYLQRHGFPNIIGVKKGAGSVEDGVAHLRSYERIVVHPSCVQFLEESRLYSFKVDRLTGNVLPDIVDKHNHLMDALRYALEPLISAKDGAGWAEYFRRQGDGEDARREQQDADPHHKHDRVWVNGARPDIPPRAPKMFERLRAERAGNRDF